MPSLPLVQRVFGGATSVFSGRAETVENQGHDVTGPTSVVERMMTRSSRDNILVKKNQVKALYDNSRWSKHEHVSIIGT